MADALAGRDLLVRSPTGSGRTPAFGIPMVDRLDARASLHARARASHPGGPSACRAVRARVGLCMGVKGVT
jgi:superfamily II DNA/RNA helicase